MKKSLLLFSVFAMSFSMYATDVQLIVERLDNKGAVPGNTFRIYAQMPTSDHSLHIIFGDQTNPLTINSTASFYQHQYAGYSAASMNASLTEFDASAKFDSWITVGYADNAGNDMWDLGVDFSEFNTGGSINANNGGWFLLPTDEKCNQDANHLVLIGQLTTTGIATGTMNVQGWTAPNVAWRADGLTFSTSNAQTFGCMDSKASNYNAEATFNDGTCQYTPEVAQSNSAVISKVENESAWEVFPNPLRDNILNVQFRNLDVKELATRIDIIDMTGKLVASHSISADAVLPGNRVTLKQELAAGTYKAVLVQNGFQESKTIIVEK